MKNYVFALLILLMIGCKKKKDSWGECGPKVTVSENGVNYESCVGVIWQNKRIGIHFERYIDGLMFQVTATIDEPYSLDSVYTLHGFGIGSRNESMYGEWCCYYTLDQPNAIYYIEESDSVNNYVQLKIDTSTHQSSGVFKATFKNRISPYDLIHFKCDNFSCEYIKE